MGIFDGCLLVSDIDGTLAVDGRLIARNLEAAERFKAAGGVFTIATGRGPTAAKALCQKARINAPALLSNGSVLFDAQKEAVLSAEHLSEAAKEFTYHILTQFPNVGAEVTLSDCIITLQENPDTVIHREKEEFTLLKPDKESAMQFNWIKVLFMTSNQEAYRSLCEYMDKNCPEDSQLMATSPTFYELHPKGVNKGLGLKKLATLLKIPQDQVFAIGDYYNDREMIAAAAVGACVAHSPEELKATAQFVGGEAGSGAVADFIDYITEQRRQR